MTPEDLALRRDYAADLARQGAALAARLRAQGGGVARMKGVQDFVTEADGETEAELRARITKRFPGEPILGEEMGGAPDASGWLWILDPIDGTANYARGSDRWCCSVGLAYAGRAVGGAIARNAPAELFMAAEGMGASMNGRPLHAAPTTDPTRAILELGWSARVPLARFQAMVAAAQAEGAALRLGGSGALGLVEVAAGRLDAYLEAHINSWDACAAIVIAREAGCWTTPFDSGDWLTDGNPIGVGAPGLGVVLARLLG
jgi:myo-inositol-1(or 4)-monophosphatase